MDIAAIQETFDRIAAPYVRALGLQIVAASEHQTTLRMPITSELIHVGGAVCGQSVLAAADTAMVVATSVAVGGFRPMTTVQLQTSFLRPMPASTSELRLVCHVLRKGKTLAFGEIEIFTPDGKLAAHATTTYAFL